MIVFFKKLSIITIKTFICFIFTFIFIIFGINLIFLDFFWFEFLEPRQWSILFYFIFLFFVLINASKKIKKEKLHILCFLFNFYSFIFVLKFNCNLYLSLIIWNTSFGWTCNHHLCLMSCCLEISIFYLFYFLLR